MKGRCRFIVLSLTLSFLILESCTQKPGVNKIPVAKVNDKVLYLSDIQHIFPSSYTKQDSINMAQSYINTWVKTQLLLGKAELNLSPEQLDISQQLDAYRSSLLIYKYEDQLVNSKIDTVVKESEIQDYYNQNTSNFMLNENLVKALYIKIPRSAPDIEKAKRWYKSDNKEDIAALDNYCFNYATKYDYFNDKWVSFSLVHRLLPKAIDDEDNLLNNSKYIEQEDEKYIYLVNIKDIQKKGTLAPLDFISPRIKDIIINKRKVNFLNDLETNIYNDAQDHDQFEIYNIDTTKK